MDNLDVLRGMNSKTVDLIATDPPFNKKRNRAGTAGQYEDAWRWTDHPSMQGKRPDQWMWQPVHRDWLDEIKDANPALFDVIEATRKTQDDDTAAFLCFLSVRLLEMHRVLKSTGSIYLHCDHTANAYIRMCMDAIFGARNFRNEIIWERIKGAGKTSQHGYRKFGSSTDSLFFYTKARDYDFDMDSVSKPYSDEDLSRDFPHRDERGRYRHRSPFRPPGLTPRPNLCYEYREVSPPHPSGWTLSKERLAEEDARGEIIWRDDKPPIRKQRPRSGKPLNNLWHDIDNPSMTERTGSPDQKPLALYERIIKASSHEGDLVLDPFAGCATTPIAARNLKRRWVGIDRRRDARFHVVCRMMGMKKADADKIRQIPHLDRWLNEQLAKNDAHYRTKPPVRTDMGETAAPHLGPVYSMKRRTIFTHSEMHAMLVDRYGMRCWGCVFDGSIYGERGRLYLELDHVDPKSAGGHDDLDNRALLCGPCNRAKGDRRTLVALRRETMGRAARRHPIDLRVAREWCHNRLREELLRNPELGI